MISHNYMAQGHKTRNTSVFEIQRSKVTETKHIFAMFKVLVNNAFTRAFIFKQLHLTIFQFKKNVNNQRTYQNVHSF